MAHECPQKIRDKAHLCPSAVFDLIIRGFCGRTEEQEIYRITDRRSDGGLSPHAGHTKEFCEHLWWHLGMAFLA